VSGRRNIYQVTSDVRCKATNPSSSKYTHSGPEPFLEDFDPTLLTINADATAPFSSPALHTFFSNTKNASKISLWRLAFPSLLLSKNRQRYPYVCFKTQTSLHMFLSLEYCDYTLLHYYSGLDSAQKQKPRTQTRYVLLLFGVRASRAKINGRTCQLDVSRT